MKMNYSKISGAIFVICLLIFRLISIAQTLPTGQEIRYNPIFTAVPFLTITPDSRHGAMGNVGAATSPDANSQYLNPSKYPFAEENFGFSASYVPWLRKVVDDMNLAYISGFVRIGDNQAIASSLRYFSMGDVELRDQNNSFLSNAKPGEFAVDFSYSRKLSQNFSGGVALRYIHSDLTGGFGSGAYSPASAFATDVSFFYNKHWEGGINSRNFAFGVDFSNIGSKISYNEGQTKEFLPANMRLGFTYTNQFDRINSLSFSLDVNKLLVPTPKRSDSEDGSGTIVLEGNNSNESVVSSLFSSFTDAPGGLHEELQEFTVSTGLEYLYNKRFALRAGYFNETQSKGNRKFFTAGAGIKISRCSIDFSYLMPVNQDNPLANTIRFTILFDSNSFRKGTKSVARR